ncbi:protein-lysine N-methyltransferase EEF2KMT-like isoform X1 [Choristoneura fumiferana]|uniref:protein-lysine N-methyltransferase EEF2KMT-like isoform X1 n=2 Tax=Choristoneura fumiferana TaxID=7141 RepID=UPI003D159D1D
MSLVDKTNKVVFDLVKCYLKGSLTFHLEPEEAKVMCWDNQQAFVNATIHNQLLQNYPVNNEFSKLFFKKLIDCIESYHEIHDDFYTFLCFLMNKKSLNTFCHRHYVLNNDTRNIITIMETNNMVVNGTTGMRTWEAALTLADWALSNKDVFAHKKVVELGSGVGFTGITIAKECNLESIVLTDCHNDVLKTIKRNIKINLPKLNNSDDAQPNAVSNIDVMMLDWNDAEDLKNNLVPDILIGADIVYDPSILQPLCNVIKSFFDKNDLLEVYIASMIRNVDTFNSFLEALEYNEFKYFKLAQENCVFIEWDHNNKQRCTLKIIKNK